MATFILDTRNQKDDFVEVGLRNLGHTIIRSKLPFGDVALSTDILNCIDLKSSGGGLLELAGNICSKDHARLKSEIVKCLAANGKITFLIFESGVHCLEDVKFWKVPTYKHNQWGDVYYYMGKRIKKSDLQEGVPYDKRHVMLHNKGEPMTKIAPEVLYKALKTMSEPNHYAKGTKVSFVFTTKYKCGKAIEEILL